MVRNFFGILLALVGAAAAVFSPFRDWYGGRLGRFYRVEDLFSSTGITDVRASLFAGLFLPMIVAGGLTLIAVLLRSRFVVSVAGLVVVGFTALWMVRQGQSAGSLTAGGNGLGEGAGLAAGGGVLLLLGTLVMRGRGRHVGSRRRGAHARLDERDSYAPHDDGADYEPSEFPQPYGSFGTTHGPHGAYQADDGHPPPPRRYEDDATPAEEWDPWEAGRPQPEPPQGPQRQPPGPPMGPSDTQRIPRRPDHRRDGQY